MADVLICIYGAILAIFLGHYLPNKNSWQHATVFGGLLNPPTLRIAQDKRLRGELSFLTWVFHWSMAIDYCLTLPKYMWKWSGENYTRNEKWKLYTVLHLPAFAVVGTVLKNHLHRDQIVALKAIHPILVFIASTSTLVGSFAASRANGWNHSSTNKAEYVAFCSIPTSEKEKLYPSWDIAYSLASIAIGSLLSYGSLHLTV